MNSPLQGKPGVANLVANIMVPRDEIWFVANGEVVRKIVNCAVSSDPAAVPVPEEDWSKVERIEWRNTKYEGWYENGMTTHEEDKSGFVSTVREADFNRLLAAYTKLKGERI